MGQQQTVSSSSYNTNNNNNNGNVANERVPPSCSSYMPLATIGIIHELKQANCKRVFIAGCGGGYDIFSGLPLYFALVQDQDIENVILGNLAFTQLGGLNKDGVTQHLDITINTSVCSDRLACHLVHSKSENGIPAYFPEKYLCQYLVEKHGEHETETVIYTFDRSNGVKSLTRAYEAIIQKHSIDAVVLIDGGTDSLMRGDERGLGSPDEDALSITSVYNIDPLLLPMKNRFLLAVGFGVDTFHGVSHYHFLENVAAIAHKYEDGYLGSFSLLKQMRE